MTNETTNKYGRRALTIGIAVLMVLSLFLPLVSGEAHAAFTGKKGSQYTVHDGGRITYGSGEGGYWDIS